MDWSPTNPWAPLTEGVTVVTGAAGGIGRRIVERIIEVGGTVLAADLDEGALVQLASEHSADRLFTQICDVSLEDDMRRLESRVQEIGIPLRLWVNNAGTGLRKPAADVTADEWDRVFGNNVRSVFLGCKAAYRQFGVHGQGGSIVNVASVAAVRAMPGRSAYGTTKAAVAHLTRQLAREWGGDQIRVNAVAPGFILTPISHLYNAPADEILRAVGDIPSGRLGTVDDVARAVLVLGADISDYQTGQLLVIDGGLILD